MEQGGHVHVFILALHTHQTWPRDKEYVTMDFFRRWGWQGR
jgi:predicted SnoaL-like aldol condensation-catalyzing enzyme